MSEQDTRALHVPMGLHHHGPFPNLSCLRCATEPKERPMSDIKSLVDRVNARTSGTKGDPLSREEVEQIVLATLKELERDKELEDGDDAA